MRKTRSGTRRLKSPSIGQEASSLVRGGLPDRLGSIGALPVHRPLGPQASPGPGHLARRVRDDEDVVLCAITSRLPERFSEWEASLGAEDIVEERLPKRSVVKVGKLFTMHRSLIARRFGTVKEYKLEEILSKLRTFFARPPWISEPDSEDREVGLKTKEIDEAVLGLLYLNAFKDHGQVRAWKTFDWDAMDRLHDLGLIGDPKSKAKSVPLTAEGVTLAKESFRNRFALQ